jgi:sugar (pentulose or hexulose) kinase
MTRLSETFEPDMRVHAVYCQMYEQVYLRMYRKLQPFYKAMQNLTLPEEAEIPKS